MRELVKVVGVTRKRANVPVHTVLVIDATTGQNGMQQAREFDRALDLDALVVTKLDGTAKGGIALAISHELGLPIVKVGVGEGIDDLRDFDAHDFVRALIGDFEEEDLVEDGTRQEGVAEVAAGDAAQGGADAQPAGVPDAVGESAAATLPAETATEPAAESPAQSADDAPQKMSWAEFVAADDARRAAEPQKKHFWEKW